jgi:hypothetical protein
MVDPEDDQQEVRTGEPELMAQLAPLLRARSDLGADDVTYLEEVIGAAVRRFAADREARSR